MSEIEALRLALEEKQKIISVMESDLLALGVNFDYDKAIERYDILKANFDKWIKDGSPGI